ncbi:MAG: calcium-binding protein, partial [Limisphaerales bacterium]
VEEMDFAAVTFKSSFVPLPTMFAAYAKIRGFEFIGAPGLIELEVGQLELYVNGGDLWPSLTTGPTVDFLSSFPAIAAGSEGGPKPAGFAVPTGGTPIYLTLPASNRVGLSLSNATLRILDVLHFHGNLAFDLGATQQITFNTGLGADGASVVEALGFEKVIDVLGALFGLESLDGFRKLKGFDYRSLIVGGSDISAFVGFGRPDFNRPFTEQNLMGFGLDDVSFGVTVFVQNLPSISTFVAALPGLVVFASHYAAAGAVFATAYEAFRNTLPYLFSMKMTVGSVGAYGFGDIFTIQARDIVIEANVGTPWLGAYSGASLANLSSIDFKLSFPATDGKPAGLEVPTGGAPVLLDYEKLVIGVKIGFAQVSITDFLHLSGSLAFELGPTHQLQVDMGISQQYLDTVAPGLNLSNKFSWEYASYTFGGQNLNASVGLGGPYFSDTTGDGRITEADERGNDFIGFVMEEFDFGVALFQPTTYSPIYLFMSQVLSTPYEALFFSAKATAEKVGFVGGGDTFQLEANNLEFGLNISNLPTGTILPFVDFAASFPGGGGTPVGFPVPTGASNTYLDYDSYLFRAQTSQALLRIADFAYLSGSFAFEFGRREIMTVKNVLGFGTGGTSSELEMLLMTVGASNVNAFIGINGPYLDANGVINEDAIGLTVADLDVGLLIGLSTLTLETFLSVKASASLIGVVGLDDPIAAQARDLTLQINNLLGTPLSPNYWVTPVDFLLPGPAIDYKATFETADGAKDGTFELNTGDPLNPVLLDFDSQLLRAGVGSLFVNFGGFAQFSGSGFLEIGPTQEMFLTNSRVQTLRTLTFALANINGFFGVGGYFVDTNMDGYFDTNDTPNPDAVGFLLKDLDLGFAIFQSVDLLDPGLYFAGRASVETVGLIGVPGVTATASDFNLEFNFGASLLSGLVAVDFSRQESGNFAIKTGNPTAPILLNYNSMRLRASGTMTMGINDVAGLSGSFDIEVGDTRLLLFADATLSVGSMADPLFSFDASGLLVMSGDGIASRIALTLQGAFPTGLGVKFDASFELLLNSTGEDFEYLIPTSFAPVYGETRNAEDKRVLLISGTPPGKTTAAPYYAVAAAGSLTFLDAFTVAGKFTMLLTPSEIEVRVGGLMDFRILDVVLLSFSVDGTFILQTGVSNSRGAVGALQLTLLVDLPATAAFSLQGTYQLEVNTTTADAQISRFKIDDAGAVILSGGNPVQETITITAQSKRIYMGGKLVVGGQSLIGSYLFESSTALTNAYALVNVNAKLDLLGIVVSVQGAAVVKVTPNIGIAFDLALSVATNQFSLLSGAFVLNGEFRIRLNTFGTQVSTIGDLTFATPIPAGPYLRVAVTNAQIGIAGVASFTANSVFLEVSPDGLKAAAIGIGIQIGSTTINFGSAAIYIGSDGFAIGARSGFSGPQQIIPGMPYLVLEGGSQFTVNTTGRELTIGDGDNSYTIAGNVVAAFSGTGKLYVLDFNLNTLLFIYGSINTSLQGDGSTRVDVAGYTEVGFLGSMAVSGTFFGSASQGVFAALQMGGSSAESMSAVGVKFRGQFQLELNLTSTARTIQRFEVDANGNVTTNQIAVSIAAYSARVAVSGRVEIGDLMTLHGYASLSVSANGITVELDANVSLLGSSFRVQGGAGLYAGTDGGIAMNLTMTLNSGSLLSGVGFEMSGTYQLRVNSTSIERTLAGVVLPALSVGMRISGQMIVLSVLDISGTVDIAFKTSGFEFTISGTVAVPVIGGFTVKATLTVNSDGMFGSFEAARDSVGSNPLFSFNSNYRFAINTTGSAKTVQVLKFSNTSGAVTGTRDILLAANSVMLSFAGELKVGPNGAQFSIKGGADIMLGATTFALTVDGTLNMLGLGTLEVKGSASINRTTGHFSLDVELGAGTLNIPDVGLNGTFRLQLNTASNTYEVSFSGKLQIWVFKVDVSASIRYSGSVLRFSFDADLNFFNVVDIRVSGYVQSNGEFRISGSVGVNFDIGPFEWRSEIGITLSNDEFSGYAFGKLLIDLGVLGDFTLAGIRAEFSFNKSKGEVRAEISVEIIGIEFSEEVVWSFEPPPILAKKSGSTLYIHMGVDAAKREHQNTTDSGEQFSISQSGSSIKVSAFGFTEEHSGVSKIVIRGTGKGNDKVTLNRISVPMDITLDTGSDKVLVTGSGDATVTVKSGNHTIETGSGDDTIRLNVGNNSVEAGSGNDTITVGSGSNTIRGEGGNDTYIFGSSFANNTIIESGSDASDKVDFSGHSRSLTFTLNGSGYTITNGSSIVINSDRGVDIFVGSSVADIYNITNTASHDVILRGSGGTDTYNVTFGALGGPVTIDDASKATDIDFLNLITIASGQLTLSDTTGDAKIRQGTQEVNYSPGYDNVDRINLSAVNAPVLITGNGGAGAQKVDLKDDLVIDATAIVWDGVVQAGEIDFHSDTGMRVDWDLRTRLNGNVTLLADTGDLVLHNGIYSSAAHTGVGDGSGHITLRAPAGTILTTGNGWLGTANGSGGYVFDRNLDWALRLAKYTTNSLNRDTARILVEGALDFEQALYLPNGSQVRAANGSLIASRNGKLTLQSDRLIGQVLEGFEISPLALLTDVKELSFNNDDRVEAYIVDLDQVTTSSTSRSGFIYIISLLDRQSVSAEVSGNDDPVRLNGNDLDINNPVITTEDITVTTANPSNTIVVVQNENPLFANPALVPTLFPEGAGALVLDQQELNYLLTSSTLFIGSEKLLNPVILGDGSMTVLSFGAPSTTIRGDWIHIRSPLSG